MASQFYTWRRDITLAANSAGQIQIFVSPTLVAHMRHWLWSFQGTANITDVNINNATHLVEASTSVPLLSTFVQPIGSSNFNMRDFDGEWTVLGNQTLIINLVDTSAGSNLVRVAIWGQMDYP